MQAGFEVLAGSSLLTLQREFLFQMMKAFWKSTDDGCTNMVMFLLPLRCNMLLFSC